MQNSLFNLSNTDQNPNIKIIPAIKNSPVDDTNLSIFSWNLNGIRAVIKKDLFNHFMKLSGDIICFQETKAKPDQVSLTSNYPKYHQYWHSANRPGYSSTLILSKLPAINYTTNFPPEITKSFPSFADDFGDTLSEGRIQTLEFKDFFLVNVYTPNSKANLERLNFRYKIWDKAFLAYLKLLEKTKPVITCGDFNSAHQEIDLARPKSNHKSAGFTDQERLGITNLINANFLDTFRFLYPNLQKFTWWSNIGNARSRDVGWRIDYFFISNSLKPNLLSADIHSNIFGSDHCPVSINLNLNHDK